MKTRLNNFMTEALRQGLLIILIAVAVSLSVNHFRKDGLTLVSERVSPAPKAGLNEMNTAGEPVISIEEARALFLTNGAVFVDARPEEVYRSGHIKGALNLPADSAGELQSSALAQIPPDSFIIAYCDGEDCPLSKEVALQLSARGFSNVQVLVNGWTAWQDAGLPTEKQQ
jgi:rhodanese-related sulfurtransferase